jgi:hypothetical protein
MLSKGSNDGQGQKFSGGAIFGISGFVRFLLGFTCRASSQWKSNGTTIQGLTLTKCNA